jgi:hypothetical protein
MKAALDLGRKLGEGLKLSLPNLSLKGITGERLGSSTGSSLEFQDYRDYQPGDDLRRLDWAAYARSDKLTVRLYREEIQPRVDILSDTSISMTIPEASGKAETAIALAGVFAEAAFKAETAVSWKGFGNGWNTFFQASNSFPQAFELPQWDGGFSIDEEFSRKIPSLANKGIRICISDFLWQVPPEIPLRRISESASEVILIAILSEEELNPSFSGPSTLRDAESPETLDLMIGETEKKAYMERLNNHLNMWEDIAFSQGARFCLIKANPENNMPDISPLVNSGILEWF